MLATDKIEPATEWGGREPREETRPGFGFEAVWAQRGHWPEMTSSGAGRGKQTHKIKVLKRRFRFKDKQNRHPRAFQHSVLTLLPWLQRISVSPAFFSLSIQNIPSLSSMLLPPLLVPEFLPSSYCLPHSSRSAQMIPSTYMFFIGVKYA